VRHVSKSSKHCGLRCLYFQVALGSTPWQQALPVLLADHPPRMAHWHPRLHDKRRMSVEHVCLARRMVVRRRGQGPLANAVRDMFMPMVVAPWCTLDVSSGALRLLLQMADVRVRRRVQPGKQCCLNVCRNAGSGAAALAVFGFRSRMFAQVWVEKWNFAADVREGCLLSSESQAAIQNS